MAISTMGFTVLASPAEAYARPDAETLRANR